MSMRETRTAFLTVLSIAAASLVCAQEAPPTAKPRGEFSPIDISDHATIVSTKGMFFAEGSTVERLVFPDWDPKTFAGVPFQLVDPQGDTVRNVILLNGPQGTTPPRMPKSVSLPCGKSAQAIHFLSGVSGWGAKSPREQGPVTMIVRLHFEDSTTEDHSLYDGQHFADYIGRFDVPKSKFAFALRGQQLRYFAISPGRSEKIERIELVKGQDRSAPVVMAVTVESPSK
ncbi:MAG: hypothetical protein O2820_16395 [Planctomycetota bacterium]|nr:hypothetical protein [Planctomycetota bacterium]MDA1250800.1 hypothetical protein [Planctomycetota bacterium]